MLLLAEIFFNSLCCTQFTQGSVGLRNAYCRYTFPKFFGVYIYKGKVVTGYEGNMDMGQYYF